MSDKQPTPIAGKIWFTLILFGLFGQIAWSVENMYFNVFLFDKAGGTTQDISIMVAASAITATVTTLFMGALSDKLNRRKMFIVFGYLFWGVVTFSFAFITWENIARVFSITEGQAQAAAALIVIIMDCIMTFFGSTANDACFNAWVTDITDTTNRGRVEGVLSALPLFALLIVAGTGGVIISTPLGYSGFFMILGAMVLICGVVGIFTVKDSGSGIKSSENYFKNIFYGFRPAVVKNNLTLYVVFAAIGIYGISNQIFMPYLIIYLQYYLGFEPMQYSLVLGLAILFAGVVSIFLGRLVDKYGKTKFIFFAAGIYCTGLILLYFARTLVSVALIGAFMLAGFILISVIFNAAVRDHTPDEKVGMFQGIRMVFYVLIPMVLGPSIGNAIINANSDTSYLNEYGQNVLVPVPQIMLGAAAVGIFLLIPVYILVKRLNKEQKIKEMTGDTAVKA